jgi:hypothetical protein
MAKFKTMAIATGALHVAASPKYALAGATGVTAAVTSSAFGFDPLAWGIGGLGGAFLYLRGLPVGRPEAISNALLSIVLGGVAAPVAYISAALYYPELRSIPGQYLVAIVLSFGWPPLSKLALSELRTRLSALRTFFSGGTQ